MYSTLWNISLPCLKRGVYKKVTERQMWGELVRRQKEKTVLYIFIQNKQTAEKKSKWVVRGFGGRVGVFVSRSVKDVKSGKKRWKECRDSLNPIGTHRKKKTHLTKFKCSWSKYCLYKMAILFISHTLSLSHTHIPPPLRIRSAGDEGVRPFSFKTGVKN